MDNEHSRDDLATTGYGYTMGYYPQASFYELPHGTSHIFAQQSHMFFDQESYSREFVDAQGGAGQLGMIEPSLGISSQGQGSNAINEQAMCAQSWSTAANQDADMGQASMSYLHAERQPTSDIIGLYYAQSQYVPKLCRALDSNPFSVPANMRAVGYLFLRGVGIFPYFARIGAKLEDNHALVGLLKRQGTQLDMENKVWLHFREPQDLAPGQPLLLDIMSIMRKERVFNTLEVDLQLVTGLMGAGSTLHSPTLVWKYNANGDPGVIEHGTMISYDKFIQMVLAAQLEPIEHYHLLTDPALGGGIEMDDEDENDEVETSPPAVVAGSAGTSNRDSIYMGNGPLIKMVELKQIAPTTHTIVTDTGFYFQAQFIQGVDLEFLWDKTNLSNRSANQKRQENLAICMSAWGASLARNSSLRVEATYLDRYSPNPGPLNLTTNRFYGHILDKRSRVARALTLFIDEEVDKAIKDLGTSAKFLALFGSMITIDIFQNHGNRVLETLLGGSKKLPFHEPHFVHYMKILFRGPTPINLKSRKGNKSASGEYFDGMITDDIVAFGAAAWLQSGIQIHKGSEDDAFNLSAWGDIDLYTIYTTFATMKARVSLISKDENFVNLKADISFGYIRGT